MTERRRKRLAALALTAALTIGTAVTATADAQPATPVIQQLQHRLDWAEQHIHKLNHRRAYLKRFIRELRERLHPAPVATTSTGSYSTSAGPLRISEAQAATYMRDAGFPESVIAWFNNGIIQRESGYCPTAVYPGHCGDVSLFVVGGPACSLFQLYTCPGPAAADPAVAARLAYQKYLSQGLGAWGG